MPILELKVASGADLSVRRFTVEESVSTLSTIAVWARCEDPDVDLEGIIGKDASLKIVHGVRFVAGLGSRTWKGVVTHVEQVHGVAPIPGQKAESTYFLRIAPKAWLLTQRRGHRIYQHLSIPDIIDKLLGEWSITPVWKIDRGTYPKLEYKVQYGESDYAFMSRLVEEAGIAFTFPDEVGTNITFHDKLEKGPKRGGLPVPYIEEPNQESEKEFVTNVRLSHEVRPGLVTMQDYNFRKPSYTLRTQSPRAAAPEDRYEQYHYQPGAFLVETGKADDNTPVADDKGIARHDEPFGKGRAERALLARRMGRGQVAFDTNCPDVAPGAIFNIGHHPHPDITDGTNLLVIDLRIEGSPQDEWNISGRAVFADVVYRPPLRTPKPKLNNVQSATVVGPAGQEIHVDEFGRVRVQFPWDREGKFDDGSSCWIRVSQGWAGTGYGMIVIPRIGQEVLVGFLDGDPDMPIITGRVFNATQIVPYELPKYKTRSAWKSNSSLGGNGFNEIMFEDLKTKELVWMQAEKNLRKLVKNDEIITIGHDRQKYVVRTELETTSGTRIEVTGVNRTEITDQDRSLFVGDNSLKMVKGDEHEKTEGNMKLLIEKDQDIVVRQMKRERVEKDMSLYVVGNRNERVDGTLSVTVDKNHYEKIAKNAALEVAKELHLKAGTSIVIEAAKDLTIKGPGGFIRIDSSGVTIRGTLVRINSGGSAGSGAGASPILPDEALLAVVEEPDRPKPIDLRVDGIGQ
ncbi:MULTISPECIES: type VI secretion system Vgr family protein [Polyangium]|uniref:Type VI secretion system tip protein VgrG n=2 Tax=Polyangium TaxID=55 RepID=A0A4U1J951_9BACT|nr:MULTISPECIES: type VI secretion system tip protein TssI/VgrG [Polyangium]MDI1430086.1 type VI secretion system tip protein TssI/VgrG [Polyangium sorediatum]TKD04485.1 type VI secretion system tip protein VgrG [Polyangium fumosum]